jgi:hypothetical protein
MPDCPENTRHAAAQPSDARGHVLNAPDRPNTDRAEFNVSRINPRSGVNIKPNDGNVFFASFVCANPGVSIGAGAAA